MTNEGQPRPDEDEHYEGAAAKTLDEEVAPEGGEAGEGGASPATNEAFVAAVFTSVPANAHVAVCSKSGDPAAGGWTARRALESTSLSSLNNNYVNCSSFYEAEDGSFRARKSNFATCHFVLLDDLGTKIPLSRVEGFTLSWLIETSPGNYQAGIILQEPLTSGDAADKLVSAIINAGLSDAGAGGPMSRWARLPFGINGKPKHSVHGKPFQCRLVEWRPDARYTPEEIVAGLELQVDSSPDGEEPESGDQQRASSDVVVEALIDRGLYKKCLDDGKHDITCPWLHEHTDQIDSGTAYFEPSGRYPLGGFCCMHSHRSVYHIQDLLETLGIEISKVDRRPTIRIRGGNLHDVIDRAERVLAETGLYYQSGGLIVTINEDPATGDAQIVPLTVAALTNQLSKLARWEKYDSRAHDWVQCDPPARHMSLLFDEQKFAYLPTLAGIARQPYFREVDGELVLKPGYNPVSQLYGVFDAESYNVPEKPSIEDARNALGRLNQLLDEFSFASDLDRGTALAAILTAATRVSLPYAPAFHVHAPVSGSGKTYLSELVGIFAGPTGNAKVSYPTSSEEATKVFLALLLQGTAVIEFDDMDTDWLPHGVIKRALTSERITDRVLGVSKTATVSTRALVLGSGNNVGPVRDLLRRVMVIRLDPRLATPAARKFTFDPLKEVKSKRAAYVSDVLTIIQAWKTLGSLEDPPTPVATYGGAWSDHCRFPLIWLGLPDPAAGLLDQVRSDPDAVVLLALAKAWYGEFGPRMVTLREVMSKAENSPTLREAIVEFPVEERGEINRSKLGWILKKNVNRIVGEFRFEQGSADGRTGWRFIKLAQTGSTAAAPGAAGSPPSAPPPSPPSPASDAAASPSGGRWTARL